jgi:hypothetical protein
MSDRQVLINDPDGKGVEVLSSAPAGDTGQRGLATPVPISGTVTATGPLTDTQLRASAVAVSGPLTDAQLRASAFAVDVNDRAARLVGVVSGAANVFHVDDNAGSLTVDAPVGTPVFARLSDGAAVLIGQKAMASSLPVVLASDQSVLPAVAEQRASTLWVTATGAVNTAVTLTLPAAGAGLFHYITSIQV